MSETTVQMVRFHVKPEFAEPFEKAIRRLFEAVRSRSIEGIRYGVCRLSDGTTYQGVLELEAGVENPLPSLPEGKAFLEGAKTWLAEPPARDEGFVVGSYRFC